MDVIFINLTSTYLVVKATCETLAFSKHMAASRSSAGRAVPAAGAAASSAAAAPHAPAAHSASCSPAPQHQMDRMRTTHARAVGEPSRAISEKEVLIVTLIKVTVYVCSQQASLGLSHKLHK